MASNRRKRFLRRIGWNALIVLALLLIAAAVGLWLGPPRDPKSFALDNEDFGLGIRPGDPWNPDSFEKTLNLKGLNVTRTELQENPSGITGSKHGTRIIVSWLSNDGYLEISACSNEQHSKVWWVSMMSSYFNVKWNQQQLQAAQVEAAQLYPNDERKQFDYLFVKTAQEARDAHPQNRSAAGIGIGSRMENVIEAYGKPTTIFDVDPSSPTLYYWGDKQNVSFCTEGGLVTIISVNDGYHLNNPAARLDFWADYILVNYIF